MSLPPSIKWAADKHYFHHSNPASKPLCRTLFEKCVIRPKVSQAWAVIKGDKVGDTDAAKATVNLYKDDNANMLAGRVVQDCANLHLIDGHTIEAVIRQGLSRLDEYQPRTWDDGKDERKLAVNRAEFADVLTNAIEGVKEAHAHYGLNRIDGESEIFTNLSGLELPYSGFPDFSRRIELKTKWTTLDKRSKTGVKSASLPQQPDWPHVCQVAGYWAGTGLMQTIVYARKTPTTKNAVGYRVFNADNSDRLTNEGLQAALNHITAKCAIRENILKSANSVEQMLRLIEPDFSHIWAWDLRPEVLTEAKKLWGFK
tara:strand:- start:1321 stop:2262 length:942 start_codon:yes stop_codon:yes gene_type:complete